MTPVCSDHVKRANSIQNPLPRSQAVSRPKHRKFGRCQARITLSTHDHAIFLPGSLNGRGVDGSRWASRTSTPLACVLRRARRVRLPCTPASDLRCESSGCLESNFFLVPIIGQDFWRGRAPARDFRGFADLLPRTFPRVSSQTGVYDGPGLCIVRVHPPVVHHKFECGELPAMSRRHFRGDRVVTSQITKTPFRSGWFAPIEACTIRYEHRHAAKWAQWNGYMGLVAILNFGYYRPRRIKIRCLNWP